MFNQIVESLKRLSPATIACIENQSFGNLASALPGVESVDYHFRDARTLGGEELDVKTMFGKVPEIEERLVVLANHIIVGGLDYSTAGSEENPMTDCDGNGSIAHYGRRGNAQEHRDFYEAIGYTSDGEIDLEHDAVTENLARFVCTSVEKNRSVMTTLSHLLRSQGKDATWKNVLHVLSDTINRSNYIYAMDDITEVFTGIRYWNDARDRYPNLFEIYVLISEDTAKKMWSVALETGDIGNPYAHFLDIYEHGGTAYSMSGTGSGCHWDTSSRSAVWIPDDIAMANIVGANLTLELDNNQQFSGRAQRFEGEKTYYSYTKDNGVSWVGKYRTEWDAMDAMIHSCSVEVRLQILNEINKRSYTYAKAVVEEFNDWVNGRIYDPVVYVLDRVSGEIKEDLCEAFSTIIGYKYAEEALDEFILHKIVELSSPSH